MASAHARIPDLMLVTSLLSGPSPMFPDAVAAAALGGINAVQIREKDLSTKTLRRLVSMVQEVLAGDAIVIVNSNKVVARKQRTGLHLPEAALAGKNLRATLAPGALIGRSIHSVDALAGIGDVDYVIAGHVFPTSSKPGLLPLGLDGLAAICAVSAVPVLAIGGITPDRVSAVIAAGAHGIAVMSGINEAEDPQAAAATYREALDSATTESYPDPGILASVNGKPVAVPPDTTVIEFLHLRGQHERLVVVELNGTILRKDQFGATTISSGDVLEIVHFVGGG